MARKKKDPAPEPSTEPSTEARKESTPTTARGRTPPQNPNAPPFPRTFR